MAFFGSFFQNFGGQDAVAAVPPPAQGSYQGGYGGYQGQGSYQGGGYGGGGGYGAGGGAFRIDEGMPRTQEKFSGPDQAAVEMAARAANDVANLGKEKERKAWKAIRNEFVTLQRVWQSTAKTFKIGAELKGARDTFAQNLQTVVTASQDENTRGGAAKMLNSIVQSDQEREKQGKERVLNKGLDSGLLNVFQAERQRKLCDNLAALLQNGPPQQQPQQEERKEISTLVKGCHLDNKDLESRVRKVLRLDKEDSPEEKQRKAATSAVMDAAGCSYDRAKKALESAGGDANRAIVMLMSEREAAATKEREKAEEKAEKAARSREKAQKAKASEAIEVAQTIQGLASSTERDAWKQVRLEFSAQMKIWETQTMIMAAQGGYTVSYENTQREIEGVLLAAQRDGAGAQMLLEHALQNAMEYGLEWSNGVLVAADGVLDAATVAQKRFRLASKLNEIAKLLEAGLPVQHDPNEARELSGLVAHCALKDNTLAMRTETLLSPGSVSM